MMVRKNMVLVLGLIGISLFFVGCTKEEKALAGAGIGAGSGALIGGLAGGGTGAGIGAAAGAVLGGVIGHSQGDDEPNK